MFNEVWSVLYIPPSLLITEECWARLVVSGKEEKNTNECHYLHM